MWLNISNINYVNIFYTVAYYNQLHFYVLLKLHSLIIQQGEILPVLSYLVWRLNPYTLPGKMKNDRPSMKENVIDCAFTLWLQQSYREECTWKHISTNTQQLTQQGYWLQYEYSVPLYSKQPINQQIWCLKRRGTRWPRWKKVGHGTQLKEPPLDTQAVAPHSHSTMKVLREQVIVYMERFLGQRKWT